MASEVGKPGNGESGRNPGAAEVWFDAVLHPHRSLPPAGFLVLMILLSAVSFVTGIAEEAIRKAGVRPKIIPVRGGTDGARLGYMGLPCPNIFAGGHNFHGKFEYIPIPSMEKACRVITEIGIIVVKRRTDVIQ